MRHSRGEAWQSATGPNWDRDEDPDLWDYYAELMLEPGWAGHLTPAQMRYIRNVILKHVDSPYRRHFIRREWGFVAGTGEHPVSEAAIRAVALAGDPEDYDERNAALVREATLRPRATETIQNGVERSIEALSRDITPLRPGNRPTPASSDVLT